MKRPSGFSPRRERERAVLGRGGAPGGYGVTARRRFIGGTSALASACKALFSRTAASSAWGCRAAQRLHAVRARHFVYLYHAIILVMHN